MTGWKIFSHSVFLLKHNFKDAVRISWPLILVMVLTLALGTSADLTENFSATQPMSGTDVLLQLAMAVAGTWVAVAWHRYVLLEEASGAVPPFHGKRMLAYFFTALGIGLAVGLVTGLVIGLVGLLTFNLIPLFFVAVFVILVGAIWVFYRLSPLLPAAALGESLGVKAAWAATAQISGAVLVAVLILAISAIGIGLVIVFGLFPISISLGMAMIAVLQWAYSMVGISILTTVYGISVQGRSL
ncbi:MAG: hypothetical protein BM560_08915 [Roseobacter sp. MedPE-SWde]|nr:MAG: hypothetical protein BM560_08915 [Roseobacter sp. MedPE-SWde]